MKKSGIVFLFALSSAILCTYCVPRGSVSQQKSGGAHSVSKTERERREIIGRVFGKKGFLTGMSVMFVDTDTAFTGSYVGKDDNNVYIAAEPNRVTLHFHDEGKPSHTGFLLDILEPGRTLPQLFESGAPSPSVSTETTWLMADPKTCQFKSYKWSEIRSVDHENLRTGYFQNRTTAEAVEADNVRITGVFEKEELISLDDVVPAEMWDPWAEVDAELKEKKLPQGLVQGLAAGPGSGTQTLTGIVYRHDRTWVQIAALDRPAEVALASPYRIPTHHFTHWEIHGSRLKIPIESMDPSRLLVPESYFTFKSRSGTDYQGTYLRTLGDCLYFTRISANSGQERNLVNLEKIEVGSIHVPAFAGDWNPDRNGDGIFDWSAQCGRVKGYSEFMADCPRYPEKALSVSNLDEFMRQRLLGLNLTAAAKCLGISEALASQRATSIQQGKTAARELRRHQNNLSGSSSPSAAARQRTKELQQVIEIGNTARLRLTSNRINRLADLSKDPPLCRRVASGILDASEALIAAYGDLGGSVIKR